MSPDTANTIDSPSRVARNQRESIGLDQNSVPTRKEMGLSVQPEDREPFEDKGDLSPDNTNVEAPTEFNQASDPQPDPIPDDDLRPVPPINVTKWEPTQTLSRSHHPSHVSASNLLQDDPSMLPDTAKMIVCPSRADASEDQDAELAKVQPEDRIIYQDVASTAAGQSADGEALEDESDLSPDDTNVKAPTELYQVQDQPTETIDDNDLRPVAPTNVTSPTTEETIQMLSGGHPLDEVKEEQEQEQE
ncbi:hypothetical protein BGX34_000211 [Mortierella sp. NVP85]|nr:hypothetical protein BGX34_000211 [Mortierella sp. NVP85]